MICDYDYPPRSGSSHRAGGDYLLRLRSFVFRPLVSVVKGGARYDVKSFFSGFRSDAIKRPVASILFAMSFLPPLFFYPGARTFYIHLSRQDETHLYNIWRLTNHRGCGPPPPTNP